jgi:DNA-binding NtrC family response regulator
MTHPGAPHPLPSQPNTRPPRHIPRVLFVEDEARMRDLLVRAITSWGFEVAAAKTGEEALRMMEASPRQILLLDLNLPAMSGMEVFQRVRERWPETQVIILTGFGDLDSARRAIHLDVVEFLTKPCHLGELERAIDRANRRIAATEGLPTVDPDPDDAPAAEEFDATIESTARPSNPDTPARLEAVERQHILTTLSKNHGNRAATAAELGISLRTLYYRLAEYQKQGHAVD